MTDSLRVWWKLPALSDRLAMIAFYAHARQVITVNALDVLKSVKMSHVRTKSGSVNSWSNLNAIILGFAPSSVFVVKLNVRNFWVWPTTRANALSAPA